MFQGRSGSGHVLSRIDSTSTKMESNKPLPVNFKAGGTPEDRILAGYGKYLVHVLSNQKYFW